MRAKQYVSDEATMTSLRGTQLIDGVHKFNAHDKFSGNQPAAVAAVAFDAHGSDDGSGDETEEVCALWHAAMHSAWFSYATVDSVCLG